MSRRGLVQVSLPSTAVKATFADLSGGTVRDLVQALLQEDGQDIVQELNLHGDSASSDAAAGIEAATRAGPADVHRFWAIQQVVISSPNRRWTDEELVQVAEQGCPLATDTQLSTLIPSTSSPGERNAGDGADRPRQPARLFSDFALTAHLQVPLLRLVFLPYRLNVHFSHVPGIPEGFQYPWFVGWSTTAAEVIEALLDELGIRKLVTQGSKSARVEYTVSIGEHVLLPTAAVLPHLRSIYHKGPLYDVTLSISEAWFARIGTVAKSFSKALQRPSIGSSARTRVASPPTSPNATHATTPSGWRPASIFGGLWGSPAPSKIVETPSASPQMQDIGQDASDADTAGDTTIVATVDVDEEDGDGTLKGLEQALRARSRSPPVGAPASSSRLSSLFDVWKQPEAAVAPVTESPVGTVRARMVSEPVPVDDFKRISTLSIEISGLGPSRDSGTELLDAFEEDAEDLDAHFEQMMTELGMKDAQRTAMRKLDDDRKRFLIAQQRQSAPSRAGQAPLRAVKTGVPQSSSTHDAATSSHATFTSSQAKRFSLAGLGWTAQPDSTPRAEQSDPLDSPNPSEASSFVSTSSAMAESSTSSAPAPLLQTATGWTSWFSSGSPAKPPAQRGQSVGAARTQESQDTPAFYVGRMTAGKVSQASLVKHLIALRVRLATAQLSWIQEFLDQKGLAAIESLLKKATSGKSGSLKDAGGELDEAISMECIRCLRVLMNVEAAFESVVADQNIVTYIAFTLRTASDKLRVHAADVLAALCILSVASGHKVVLAAFSDFRVHFNEAVRFQHLVDSIAVEDKTEETLEEDDASLWEYRAAGLALINALVNGPNELEERVALREEFARRGLNEVMTTLRYTNPPDNVMTQLQVYLEERQEDHDELQERRKTGSTGDSAERVSASLPWLEELAGNRSAEYASILSSMKLCADIASSDLDSETRQNVLSLVDRFLSSLSRLRNLEEGWSDCMSRFFGSIDHLVGKHMMVRSTRSTDTASVPTSFLEELDTLRKTVEDLNEDKQKLEERLHDKTALGNTLRSLPANGKSASIEDQSETSGQTGVIQRLVQKEKEVLRLRAEVAALSAGKGKAEDAEAAKRERAEKNRQWANLMDEIAKNKTHIAEQQVQLEAKEKEIKYLKRALESVYTRFQATMDEQAAIPSSHARDGAVANVDADMMASRSIATLAEREEELQKLRAEITSLRAAAVTARPPVLADSISAPGSASAASARNAVQAPVSLLVPGPPPPPPPPSAPAAPVRIASSQSESMAAFAAKVRITRPAPKVPIAPEASSEQVDSKPAVVSSTAAPSAPPPPPPPSSLPSRTSSSGVPAPPPPPPPCTGIPVPLHGAGAPAPPAPPAFPGPPLPPPAIKLQRKATQTAPAKKLKPFFWQKIAPQLASQTIWSSIDPVEVDLDGEELEKAFAVETKTSSKATASATRAKVTSLLPISRAQNIAIMLARMRMSHTAIRDAILQVDDKKMTIDRLKALKSYVPSADETKAIRGYTGDFATLTASDQYFRAILPVPRLGERLSCMMTRRRFDMDLEELRPELAILRNAIDEVRASEKLRAVLRVVLAVGNRLNAATFRGDAGGFQLEALLKLRDTRASSGNGSTATLLHYIVRLLIKREDDLVHFLAESPHVQAASRISAAALASSVSAVTNAIEAVKAELDMCRALTPDPTDRFVPVMEYFVAEAEPAIAALTQMARQLDADARQLLEFFGEDPANSKPEDLFQTLVTFSLALQQAEDEILDEERKAKKGLRPQGRVTDGKRSIGRGGFDQALRDLKSGTGLRRQRQEASVHRPQSRIFLDGARR